MCNWSNNCFANYMDNNANKIYGIYFVKPCFTLLQKVNKMKDKKETYLYDRCPTCDQPLKNVGDGLHYACSKCGCDWHLDELEFKPIQKDLKRWVG